MLALSGAHRVGKSTLAKAFAEKNEWDYVASSTSAIFKNFGLDVNKPLTFDQRMLVQEATFEVHLDDVKKANARAITDRSTIDMAAYAMAEWAKAAEGEQQDRLYDYVDRCIRAANWLYAGWVLVQPGIPYVEEEGKPSLSKPFQEVLHVLCSGYMRDPRFTGVKYIINDSVVELDKRVIVLENIVKCLIRNHLADGAVTLH